VYVRGVQGTTFLTVLRQLAGADPGRPAVTFGDDTLTRADLVSRVENLAALFARLGVRQGDNVTIGLPNSIGFVEAMFAAWALGAVPQPISDRLPPRERAAIIELADPALVVGAPATESGGRPVLESVPRDLSPGPFTPGVAPEWKRMTSGGSTGRPKLIAAAEPAVAEKVATAAPLVFVRPEGTVLMPGPLAHNAPFSVTTTALLTGNHVVLAPRFDAEQTLRLIERYRVTYVLMVPTMMLRIMRLPEEVRAAADVSSLEVVFHLASPCPPWLKQAWIEWLGPERIAELYGGTELQAVTIITGTEWVAHRGSVGRVVVGEVEIRDPEGRPLAAGAEGEIWMRRGAGVPSPYRYIGATARSAGEGWESLGDIGKLDADGYLYITDRLADMILVGGSNVYPAEIEAALDEHPNVQSCCVFGLPHEDLGNIPYAIVELSAPASDEELLAHLRQHLAPYKLPRVIERASTPLRDDAGKVRRSALRAERLARAPATQP
jgi:bile acid-coenzyme A ligase